MSDCLLGSALLPRATNPQWSPRLRWVAPRSALCAVLLLTTTSALAQQPAPDDPEPAEDTAEPADPSDTAEPTEPTPAAPSAPPADDITERFDQVVTKSGGLTSERVAERAVATSWTVRSLEKDQQVADLNVDQAVAAYLPEVNLIARYTRLSPVDNGSLGGGQSLEGNFVAAPDPPGGAATYPADYDGFVPLPASQLFGGFDFPTFLNQYLLQASVSVPISDYALRSGHGLRAAKHNQRFAKLNRDAEELVTAANARLVYYDWVRAELFLVVVEQSRDLAKEQVEVAKRTFAGGRSSKAEVLAAEAQLSSAELSVSRARNQATLAEDRVRTIMHDSSQGEYVIGEDVLGGALPPRPAESFDRLYAEALRNRLELKALQANRKSLNEASRALRADNYPRLAAFGNAYYVNPSSRVFPQEDKFSAQWDVGVELVWTPTRIATARAETRKYEVQASQREDDIQNLRDNLRAEVLAAHQGMIEASLNIETARRGLTSAEESYRVRRKLYEYGRATTLQVTDAENALLVARLEVINARVALLTAKVRLDHAVGRDVP